MTANLARSGKTVLLSSIVWEVQEACTIVPFVSGRCGWRSRFARCWRGTAARRSFSDSKIPRSRSRPTVIEE